MKKLKIILFFRVFPLIAILFICNDTIAQEAMEDVIYLKNGGIIRGKIENNFLDKSIKIETIGRNVFVFQPEEIEKITREAVIVKGVFVPRDNGFTNITSAGAIISGSFSIQTINGYKFKSRLFTGLGVSMEEIGRNSLFSTYGDVRYDPFTGRNTPFAYLDGGYSFRLTDRRSNWGNYKYYGGFLSETGIGVKSNFNNKTALLISIGYMYRSSKYSYADWAGNIIQVTDIYSRYTIRVGFNFQ